MVRPTTAFRRIERDLFCFFFCQSNVQRRKSRGCAQQKTVFDYLSEITITIKLKLPEAVVTTAEDSEINADQHFHSEFMSHKTCVIAFRWFDYINFRFVLWRSIFLDRLFFAPFKVCVCVNILLNTQCFNENTHTHTRREGGREK